MNEQTIIIDAVPLEHAEAFTGAYTRAQDRREEIERFIMTVWYASLDIANIVNLYVVSAAAVGLIVLGMMLASSVIVAPFFRNIAFHDMVSYWMGLPLVFLGICMLVSGWWE
jgi:hypothetical protein